LTNLEQQCNIITSCISRIGILFIMYVLFIDLIFKNEPYKKEMQSKVLEHSCLLSFVNCFRMGKHHIVS